MEAALIDHIEVDNKQRVELCTGDPTEDFVFHTVDVLFQTSCKHCYTSNKSFTYSILPFGTMGHRYRVLSSTCS